MNRPVFQVEMSTDGNHKVTVTIEDPAGTDAALAWAEATYAKLVRGNSVPTVEVQQREPTEEQDPPQCEVHDVPMALVQGKRGAFWSCHEKNADGSWCAYKAASQ